MILGWGDWVEDVVLLSRLGKMTGMLLLQFTPTICFIPCINNLLKKQHQLLEQSWQATVQELTTRKRVNNYS